MLNFLLLILITFSFSISSKQADKTFTKREIIYHKILKNKPNIDKSYAKKLATIIVKKSKKHRVNPIKYTAILAQESSYRLNAKNSISNDYGISQINHRTAIAFNFNVERLLKDLEYSIEAGIIVLADFKKRYGHKEKHYWSRYNSSNASKRLAYEKAVGRYL